MDWDLGASTSLKVSFKFIFGKNIMKMYYMVTIALGKRRFILEHDFTLLFISYSRDEGKGSFLPGMAVAGTGFATRGGKREVLVNRGVL